MGDINPKIKLYLSTDENEGVFGGGKWRLLDAVKREGSIAAAAKSLGRSYRKAWGDLRRAEEGLGRSLIEPSRGGAFKGKTVLTPYAEKLLAAWDDYREDILKIMERSYKKRLAGLIESKNGDTEKGGKEKRR